jgi:L-lactate dehydrogenase
MSTVAIVGMGWVGTSVAISTLHAGIVTRLLHSDLRTEIAEGEAMDLAHGAPFYPRATVEAVSIDDITRADVVVIAAGRGGKSGESRLQLLRDNVAVARSIGKELRSFTGIVVNVTNPVDVFTHAVLDASGLPPSRVIGTGTTLDTARLRQRLARELDIDPRSVHAQVIGEHGDSEVALFSSARIGGARLRAWPAWSREREPGLADEVRRAAYEIIRRKGATNHAIGLATADLLRAILRDERRVLTVSRLQEGALGLRDVALSLPAIVDARGAVEVIAPELDDDERAALDRSAEVLRRARASIDHQG